MHHKKIYCLEIIEIYLIMIFWNYSTNVANITESFIQMNFIYYAKILWHYHKQSQGMHKLGSYLSITICYLDN